MADKLLYLDDFQAGIEAIPNMTGATSSEDGKKGLVPPPSIDDKDKFLKGNGNWETPLEVDKELNSYSENPISNNAVTAGLKTKRSTDSMDLQNDTVSFTSNDAKNPIFYMEPSELLTSKTTLSKLFNIISDGLRNIKAIYYLLKNSRQFIYDVRVSDNKDFIYGLNLSYEQTVVEINLEQGWVSYAERVSGASWDNSRVFLETNKSKVLD